MDQDWVRQTIREKVRAAPTGHYGILELHPSASPLEIRRAYRTLSKRYHPDTTDLPPLMATLKFQQLNEAYATLSNPERRLAYDRKIGYSRFNVIQVPPGFHNPVDSSQPEYYSSSAYLDATDRPLSPGEMFALFILGITFIGCLLIAIFIGFTRAESPVEISELSSNSLSTLQWFAHKINT
ncbi:J domain-containing protein [Limnofasciculus baicalensis]|uniref:J domain-containing protein n=1 Tax=Limnofasciculus baicalensis BBK-W-15 TaxID=2699891 RepID=A0AAE3KSJ2_9CYAN|nr:DnaJ domain-containing protein [Limnofasciculus baicalensis]MCP2732703.1 J domain-containing protein [Limnofasciculus baicalensis BBK-W-15]